MPPKEIQIDFLQQQTLLNKVNELTGQVQQMIPAINGKEKKRPMTAAERARNMRARRRLTKIKKRPMTASERVKKCRELKKAAKNAILFEEIAINSDSSTSATVNPQNKTHPLFKTYEEVLAHFQIDQRHDDVGKTSTNAFKHDKEKIFPEAANSNSIEIKCEPNIEIFENESDKSLELCTAVFCEPIIAGNATDEGLMGNDIPAQTYDAEFPNERERMGWFKQVSIKPLPLTPAERQKRYRQRKRLGINEDDYGREQIQFNSIDFQDINNATNKIFDNHNGDHPN